MTIVQYRYHAIITISGKFSIEVQKFEGFQAL